MPSNKQKNSMSEYIASKLEQSGHSVEEEALRFTWDTKDTRILKVDNDQGVLLIDDPSHYTCNRGKFIGRTEKAISELKKMGFSLPSFVFYKDGKNFFRNPQSQSNDLQGIRSKFEEDRSLKNYSPEDLSRILELRPVEKLILNKRIGRLEYYQPDSKRLEECIKGFGLKPVTLDYSHLSEKERFGPVQRQSKTLYLIEDESTMPGPLTVMDGHLVRSDVSLLETKPLLKPNLKQQSWF
jgi:hypothetical protein